MDWQTVRSAAAQVASGTRSVISGGANNTNAGISAVISGGIGNTISSGTATTVGGGSGNTVSGNQNTVSGGASNNASGGSSCIGGGEGNITSVGDYTTIGGGDRNQASNYNATVGGGTQNIASGDSSTVPGGAFSQAVGAASTAMGAYALARTRGAVASASGNFSTVGDAQTERLVQRALTTGATTTALSADGSTPGANTCAVLPNNSMFAFTIMVSAKVTTFGDRAAYQITGAISRGANAASTQIDGTTTVTTLAAIGGASAWVVTVTANTTLGSLQVNVTGAAATNIKWVATISLTEVVG